MSVPAFIENIGCFGHSRQRCVMVGCLRIPDAELMMVLDARLAGRSLRLIAIDLYGAARVVEEWHSDGSMRGRVRWRVKQALKLMNGGYRELVAGA